MAGVNIDTASGVLPCSTEAVRILQIVAASQAVNPTRRDHTICPRTHLQHQRQDKTEEIIM